MPAPAHRFASNFQYGPNAADGNYEFDDAAVQFEPGERIGGPLASARRKLILKAGVVGAIALGGGWAWLNHQATLSEWTAAAATAVSSALERNAPDPPAPNSPLPPLQSMATSEPPAAPEVPAESPLSTVAPSPATADPDEAAATQPAERLPPPVADPADPYQKRALAVGLHPGLSRVLLAKLSPTDYRNAGVAIKTALAETPDTDVLVWPRQRTPELALFQVKFVPGTVPDCRRYVVMVTKDSWLTTALPMEKCGVRVKDARK
jgi:hypothetical protein